ncbi:LysR family transcriptional regulator [Conexibacter stalactiti]|uniref:LysR family transcriptional regulator n=1 Tax=Conexibacter stalactiti TaxID=1940611 RepID=A0ABU4HYJ3_9ACTN|nr:LysR family transcriptional regulator [Conexibacter stalactiti]MDW5598397.1 LysR family transcriptional regulator [Conexibacter stalactiti]MEC5039039.1 LysR family transcriptional regulator [Conexibacter stalactiti]
MRIFLAVYRSGSVTAAAAQLHLSQPAVSKQLRALELESGRPLFVRGPRGVVPTQEADRLAREVGPHLDALEGATARLVGRGTDATVHVGGPADLLSIAVAPALAAAPGAPRLRLHTGVADEVLDRLAADELDIAVAARPLRRPGVRQEPLFTETLVLVGNPAWAARLPAATLDAAPLAALADVPLVAFDEELPLLRRYWREVFGASLDAGAAVTLPDFRGVVRTVSAGAGVSVVPRYVAAGAIGRGELVELHAPSRRPRNPIALAFRPPALGRPGVEMVRALLRAAAAGWDR